MEFCDKGFPTKQNLGRHMLKLHKVLKEKLACITCDKKFDKKCDLKQHSIEHKMLRFEKSEITTKKGAKARVETLNKLVGNNIIVAKTFVTEFLNNNTEVLKEIVTSPNIIQKFKLDPAKQNKINPL